MKAKKYFLLLAVTAGILYSSVWGDEQLIEKDYGGGLIGRPHPALADIEHLMVVIVPPDAEPNKESLIWTQLNTKVIERLGRNGIKVTAGVAGNILNISELRINIDMLRLVDSQQYVFHIQTSLSRVVCLTGEQKFSFKADVWSAEPVMQVVSMERMPEKVTNVVLEQVEDFIHAYLAANPKGVDSAKSNNAGTAPRVKTAIVTKSEAAEHRYVASKNGQVFHNSNCSSAGRIKPENRIFYNSREEAINAGKRPCKLCNP